MDGERADVYSNHDPFEPFDNLSIASTGSSQSTVTPKLCTALYSYTVRDRAHTHARTRTCTLLHLSLPPQARHSDELNITEGEVLDVIDWDDGEGWTKVRLVLACLWLHVCVVGEHVCEGEAHSWLAVW